MRGRFIAVVFLGVCVAVAICIWTLGTREPLVVTEQAPVTTSTETEPPRQSPIHRNESPVALSIENREPNSTSILALRGRVLASDDRPVPGARVLWLALEKEDTELTPAWPGSSWGAPPRQTVEQHTRSDGTFDFGPALEADRPYGSVLVALHPEHFPGGSDLGKDPRTWPENIEIVLERGSSIEVQVLSADGRGRSGATVHHSAVPRELGFEDRSPLALHERFLTQEAVTDAAGLALLAPFRGEQALWAEHAELVSVPWQGPQPMKVTLRLGESFTIGGTVSLPDWTAWDPKWAGERRILVAGQVGNLWRPLAHLRDVAAGPWGPIQVPLEGISRYSVRLEGIPIIPIEEWFDRPPPRAHKRIDLVAEQGENIHLLVKNEGGQLITNARALAWWGSILPGTRRVEGASRPDGYIFLGTFPPGYVSYQVEAPGFALSGGMAESGYQYDITLIKAGRITGRCTHAGLPVTDFEVIYAQDGMALFDRTRTFFGRTDGSFTIDNLPPGDWSIHASTPVHPMGKPEVVRLGLGGEAHVELELPTAIRGGGRVVAADTGDPLSGAKIQAYSSGGVRRSLPWSAPISTGQDGTFELDAFVIGMNYLTVWADGYARMDTKASATSAEFLEWGEVRLHRTQDLRLRLVGLDDLRGVEPTDLRFSTIDDSFVPEQRFAADGTVHCPEISPGDHRVLIMYPDETWNRLHLRLDPGKKWIFDHKIAGDRRLSLHVLDEEGEPIRVGMTLLVACQEDTGTFVMRMQRASDDGRADFEGIRATQVQAMVASDEGRILVTRDLSFGSEARLEATIRMGEKPVRIRVVDRERAPIPEAIVTLRSLDGAEILSFDDSDSEGWASLAGAPRGRLLVDLAHGIAGRRMAVPIDTSVDDQEFVLEGRGSLELRVADGELALENVLARMETTGGVTLSSSKQTDLQGMLRFDALGEGTYRFDLQRTDCWPVVLAEELAPDEHAVRVIQMRRLANLELTLLDPNGLPVASTALELRSLEFDQAVADWLGEEKVHSAHGLTTDGLGTLHVEGLPRGAYVWSIPGKGEAMTGSFELAAGSANRVFARLPVQ